jgi:hypothetical protein
MLNKENPEERAKDDKKAAKLEQKCKELLQMTSKLALY